MKKTKLRLKQLHDNRVVIVRISDDINRIPPKSRILQALADCYLGVGGLGTCGIVSSSSFLGIRKEVSSDGNEDDNEDDNGGIPHIGPAGRLIVLKKNKIKRK